MDEDLINNLPSEIVIDILSRLPTRSIKFCRCVCKSWVKLVGTLEFANLHRLSHESAPGLVIGQTKHINGSYQVFKINDDVGLEHHELHYRRFTDFNFPHAAASLQGSANGVLLFWRWNFKDDDLYICNPITREYIELPKDEESIRSRGCRAATYGFGASKKSGQHKVVRISYGGFRDNSGSIRASESECHVYTLGTGSWRSIAAASSSSAHHPLNCNYDYATYGYGGETSRAFVKGKLHWLVTDLKNYKALISCFDLETEVFSLFPCPHSERIRGSLCVVGNCLCYTEIGRGCDGIIWLANDDKSWTKKFVIASGFFSSIFGDALCYKLPAIYPVKFFRDGDILIAPFMFCYSTKTKTSQKLGIFEQLNLGKAIIHTPSFLSLKSFGINQTVTSF